MKIVRFQAENIKRLRAVEIAPDGNVVVIKGRNGQGKSSVLDSIWMALGGKKACPARPVRDGEEAGRVRLELDNGMVVERTVTPEGKTSLKVHTAEGARFSSPQAMLDGLVEGLSFDPLSFSRMKAKEREELLRNLAGIDFAQLDAQRDALYQDRRDEGRSLKQLEGQFAGLEHHDDAPEEEVSVAELAGQLSEAQESAARGRNLRQLVLDAERVQDAASENVEELKRSIEALQARMENELERLTEARGRAQARQAELDAHEVIDAEPIRERLANVEEVNAKVRANARRAEVASALEASKATYDEFTRQIDGIDEAKRAALAGATFPLDGLGLDADGVVLNGVPFEQASGAEQLRASVAIGLALHPKLRVLLVRDGSLLDQDSMKLLAELAQEADAQVWLERVGESDEGGVLIEDGLVAADVAAEAAE